MKRLPFDDIITINLRFRCRVFGVKFLMGEE